MSKRTARIIIGLGALGALLSLAAMAEAVIGRPLTPLSVAGVARRSVRRSAYVGAVAVGAANVTGAIGATAAPPPETLSVLPPGCVAYEDCGGVVYVPQYVDTYQGTLIVYVVQ